MLMLHISRLGDTILLNFVTKKQILAFKFLLGKMPW